MALSTQVEDNGSRTHSSVTADSVSDTVYPTSGRADRILMAVEFYNNGSNVVYVYHEANQADAVANGRPIAAGGDWSDAMSSGPWYFYTSTGTSDVRVTAVRRSSVRA